MENDDGGFGDEFILDEGIDDNPFDTGITVAPPPPVKSTIIEKIKSPKIEKEENDFEDDFVIDNDPRSKKSKPVSRIHSKPTSKIPTATASPAPEIDDFVIEDEPEHIPSKTNTKTNSTTNSKPSSKVPTATNSPPPENLELDLNEEIKQKLVNQNSNKNSKTPTATNSPPPETTDFDFKEEIKEKITKPNSTKSSNVLTEMKSPEPENDKFDDDFISDENAEEPPPKPKVEEKPKIVKPNVEPKPLPKIEIKPAPPKQNKTKIPVKVSQPPPKIETPKNQTFTDDFESFDDEPEPKEPEPKPEEKPKVEEKIEEIHHEEEKVEEKPEETHEEPEEESNQAGFFLTETNAKPYQPPEPEEDFSDDFEDFEAQKAEESTQIEPEKKQEEEEEEIDMEPEEEVEQKPEKEYTEDEKHLSDISRKLLTLMNSLIMFGASDIGSLIQEPNERLGQMMERMQTQFKWYMGDAIASASNPDHIRLRKLVETKKSLKIRIQEEKKKNSELKARLREIDRAFKNPTQPQKILNSDVKAYASQLKMMISKIQGIHKEQRDIMSENSMLEQKLKEIIANDANINGQETSEQRGRNAKLEVEAQETSRRYKEAILRMEQQINDSQEPINRLQMRLADLEKRIMILTKPRQMTSGLPTAKPSAKISTKPSRSIMPKLPRNRYQKYH